MMMMKKTKKRYCNDNLNTSTTTERGAERGGVRKKINK
jgi:hypothetical protein